MLEIADTNIPGDRPRQLIGLDLGCPRCAGVLQECPMSRLPHLIVHIGQPCHGPSKEETTKQYVQCWMYVEYFRIFNATNRHYGASSKAQQLYTYTLHI